MVRGMILYSLFGLEGDSDFFHFSLGQHVKHDLGSELEGIAESLTVCQHIDLPLGIHSGFKLFPLSVFHKSTGVSIHSRLDVRKRQLSREHRKCLFHAGHRMTVGQPHTDADSVHERYGT